MALKGLSEAWRSAAELGRGWACAAPLLFLLLVRAFAAGAASAAETNLNAAIYQRVETNFAQAVFFKPAEVRTNDVTFNLAPLLMQQVSGERSNTKQAGEFASPSLSNGVWSVRALSRPAVYVYSDVAAMGGVQRLRLTYTWWYAGATAGRSGVQGVRMTLNSAGEPVIWEVMTDSRAELVFVSESLEAAAQGEFGKPPAGRRFAVERSVAEAPKVVVARVLADGPVPMGPFVYLMEGTHEVASVLCRCMPAQAKQLVSTCSYDLVPLPAEVVGEVAQTGASFWPGKEEGGNRVERCLRLPSKW
jgi:hypothetical protein